MHIEASHLPRCLLCTSQSTHNTHLDHRLRLSLGELEHFVAAASVNLSDFLLQVDHYCLAVSYLSCHWPNCLSLQLTLLPSPPSLLQLEPSLHQLKPSFLQQELSSFCSSSLSFFFGSRSSPFLSFSCWCCFCFSSRSFRIATHLSLVKLWLLRSSQQSLCLWAGIWNVLNQIIANVPQLISLASKGWLLCIVWGGKQSIIAPNSLIYSISWGW